MAGFKIVILFIVFQLVNTRPLLFKEVHIKKNFDLSFKPPVFKPITFIKEKWTKFGHLVTKHAIVKRSPDLGPVDDGPKPIFTVSLEKSVDAGAPPLVPPPPPEDIAVQPLPPMFIPTPPELVTPVPVSVPPFSTLPPIFVTQDLSRLPVGGFEETVVITPVPPPLPPVVVPTPILPPVPPGPVVPAGPMAQGNLLTDIGRVDEINAYLKAVQALVPPPVEPVLPVISNSIEESPKPVVDEKLNSSPLVKGSRLALYFGNILLQVMSEVISSARSAISQYSQPAPI